MIRHKTPGIPKNPVISAVTILKGIEIPKLAPKVLIHTIRQTPMKIFSNNLAIFLNGHENNFTITITATTAKAKTKYGIFSSFTFVSYMTSFLFYSIILLLA